MEKIKAIIADDNNIIREILSDALSEDPDIEVVATAVNGKDAIEYIKQYNPDVVLLDLIMPVLDGIGVMEEIKSLDGYSERPFFVIISAAGKEDIVSQALQTGASYFFMKPFDESALVRRIKQLCASNTDMVRTEPVSFSGERVTGTDNQVSDILRKVGIPIKMVGYKYLKEAIMAAIEDPEALMSVTKNIYPQVASKFGTSAGNVERNIRYVIESAWSKMGGNEPDKEIAELIGDTSKKPTNSVFILSCSEWIKYHT